MHKQKRTIGERVNNVRDDLESLEGLGPRLLVQHVVNRATSIPMDTLGAVETATEVITDALLERSPPLLVIADRDVRHRAVQRPGCTRTSAARLEAQRLVSGPRTRHSGYWLQVVLTLA